MIKITKTPIEGYNYIPLSQREEETPFSVMLKPLTTKQVMVLEDKLVKRTGDSDITFSTGEFSFNTCKLGVLAWANIQDEKDQDVKIKKNADGTINDESLSLIPSEIITEIANIIMTISRDSSKIADIFSDNVIEDEELDAELKPVKKSKAVKGDIE